ncbi:Dual specificity mitogen-activated protein kinase kinase 1 [Chytriomyces hyalinus]|nr:Dual specificity mitogen-activated protein kinase kinase 1 [Chytriomyces hyalinus]
MQNIEVAPYEKSKSLRTRGSMVARLKLEGIDGSAPPGVASVTEQQYEIVKFKRDELEAITPTNHPDDLGKVRHQPSGRVLWGKIYYSYEPPDDLHPVKVLRLFEREVKQLAPLQSEYLAQIVGLCSVYEGANSSVSTFSEYMDCGSLWDIRMKNRVPDESVTSNIAVSILRGLAYLRTHGLYHGNLKLSNVLVNSRGQIKLTDTISCKRLHGCYLYHKGMNEYNDWTGKPAMFTSPTPEELSEVSPPRGGKDVWNWGLLLIDWVRPEALTEKVSGFDHLNMLFEGALPTFPVGYASPSFQDAVARSLVREYKNRITLEELLEHAWFTDVVGAGVDLLDWVQSIEL